MTHTDTIKRLKPKGFLELVWSDDCVAVEENRLTELDSPILITYYLANFKFFNMRNNATPPAW